jgi:hypothetical protein
METADYRNFRIAQHPDQVISSQDYVAGALGGAE